MSRHDQVWFFSVGALQHIDICVVRKLSQVALGIWVKKSFSCLASSSDWLFVHPIDCSVCNPGSCATRKRLERWRTTLYWESCISVTVTHGRSVFCPETAYSTWSMNYYRVSFGFWHVAVCPIHVWNWSWSCVAVLPLLTAGSQRLPVISWNMCR